MKKLSFGGFAFAFFVGLVLLPGEDVLTAQAPFKIIKVFKKYDLMVRMDSCDKEEQKHFPDLCTGPGHIDLFKKGEDVVFQTIGQDSFTIDNRYAKIYSPGSNQKPRVLYDDEYSLIVDDFNFDGEEDLAICNGHNGGYGGPSYTIYLFEKLKKKFVENKNLSKLAEGVYLGLFFPDPKKKLLRAYWKSGAGLHAEEVYRVVNNRPVLVEKTEDEATASGYSIITTLKRINGKWVKTVRRRKMN